MMAYENAFLVTETMHQEIDDGGLTHMMVSDLIEYGFSDDEESLTVEKVPISMSGRDDDVLRTGVVIIDGQEHGFQVSKDTDENNRTRIIVKIEEMLSV